MCDEGTDCSNLEHLYFNTRIVDDELEVHEDLLGFYEIENIKSDTIVYAIKDVLLRFNLSLDLCCGQIYDRASNMVGKKSGVATQISKIQPKALPTHCYGHSLSLAVKDLTSNGNSCRNNSAHKIFPKERKNVRISNRKCRRIRGKSRRQRRFTG